jgi:hypothetical protein
MNPDNNLIINLLKAHRTFIEEMFEEFYLNYSRKDFTKKEKETLDLVKSFIIGEINMNIKLKGGE